MSCLPNQILRKSYVRKNTGKTVKATCVRQAKSLTKRNKTSKVCPPGKILRKSYLRKMSDNVQAKGYTRKIKSGKVITVHPKRKRVLVSAKCVKDMGKPGKGAPTIGPLKKGELKKHGYSYKLPETLRRKRLQGAIREFGSLGTYHKLNAVAKLTSRTSPDASKTFAADRNWIKRTYTLRR